MEKKKYIVAENDSYKFYYCMTYDEAKSLNRTMSDLGNKCAIGEDSHGWFVRVKK